MTCSNASSATEQQQPRLSTFSPKQPPPPPSLAPLSPSRSRNSSTLRPKSSQDNTAFASSKTVPTVPQIPPHFLENARQSHVSHMKQRAREDPRETPSTPTLHVQQPSITDREGVAKSPRVRSSSQHSRASHGLQDLKSPRDRITLQETSATPQSPSHLLSKAAQAVDCHSERSEGSRQEGDRAQMDRIRRGRNEDLFLELANDQSGSERDVRPMSHSGRASSRMSFSGKRRSLPADAAMANSAERRPKSSGNALDNRSASRFENITSDRNRRSDQYRFSSSRSSVHANDNVSVSGHSLSGRSKRYSNVPDRSAMSPSRFADRVKSPELTLFGRRRPSFGATPPQVQKTRQTQFSGQLQDSQSESPLGGSEPKRSQPDSASAESETADTVWDEVDNLKSLIKKLELTGKGPTTSGAAVSTEPNERPRTATTAPTTIESSPKPEQKPESESAPTTSAGPAEKGVGGKMTADIHPLLHSALAKAKPLLNATLYRSLEVTASDALQLAAMTGSAGPQGTAFSAASVIQGLTASDRQVRRKADTMCRNLTDLCLALCEGKNDAPNTTASPGITSTSASNSPTIRLSRSRGPNEMLQRASSRPMSRLEARRSSILGTQSSNGGDSPRESIDDVSASEQETTPSHSNRLEPRRLGRATSRLQVARHQRYEEASGDEDPTVRPPSRAMTDVGNLRSKLSNARDYGSLQPQKSPGLRDTLAARRANSGAFEGNRELTRVASLTTDSGRRRFVEPMTPVVLEEESSGGDYQPLPPPKRRITSLGQYAPRRANTDLASRAMSLEQRRHLTVEQ